MTKKSAEPQIPPLRGAREARGLRLRQVAHDVGIDPGHLSKIERGLATPSLPVLRRLAAVLQLPELSRFLAPYERRAE